MCGIAGFYQTEFDYTSRPKWAGKLREMKESLLRRGPDDNDLRLMPHCGLAHTRLSIIDLARGRQPMQKTKNGRTCTLVYNGEIYNTQELRTLLKAYSPEWETTSDTEVILNGYLAEGTAFFQKLNGIFAFAIYDDGKDVLYICRDRLGVKPLFYQWADGHFVFGSEPKALFAWGIQPELDRESWGEIFGLGPARTPGHGVFRNMKEVLPGHFLEIRSKDCHDHVYWELKGEPHTDSYPETLEKTSWLIYDSIRRQMVSDIPICTFLSGGLDSSLVSAVCAKELKKEGKTLDTFSFDFTGNRENFCANSFQPSQDRPFVDIMVKHLDTQHTYLECTSQIQADGLYLAVDARDLPCMADVESSLLYFCSQVAKTHRVTLTGECADEIFGGYPWFHQQAAMERHHFPWSWDMSARTALLSDDFLKTVNLEDYALSAYEHSLAETPRCREDSTEEARRREISWLNIRWFMATLLNRMDRTSMYSGLEARVPFADHRILEYVYNIPWEMKCHEGRTKSLLQEAGKGLLAPEVLYRKKSPYPKTYDPGYEKMLGGRLKEVLANPSAPIRNILDTKKTLAFLEAPSDYGKPWYGQLMAGPQMTAYLLQVNYWMEKYGLSA